MHRPLGCLTKRLKCGDISNYHFVVNLLLGMRVKTESPANAKGTRDSSACMKAHCEQM